MTFYILFAVINDMFLILVGHEVNHSESCRTRTRIDYKLLNRVLWSIGNQYNVGTLTLFFLS